MRVDQVAAPRLVFHVETLQPEPCVIPTSKTFALQLLVDAFRVLEEAHPRATSAAERALVDEHPRRDDLRRWIACLPGHQEQMTLGQAVRGLSRLGFPDPDDVFVRAAHQVVTQVHLEHADVFEDDEDSHEEGTLAIEVDDAALLHHMVVGFQWSTGLVDLEPRDDALE